MALHARYGVGDTGDSIGEARSRRGRGGRQGGALGASGSGSSCGWGLGLARVAAGARLRTRAGRDSKGERDLFFPYRYTLLHSMKRIVS